VNPLKSIKLFCFSHAGGSAVGFLRWKRLIDSRITLYPIELNGRGQKANLPFYTQINEAVEDLAAIIIKEADGQPYALLGHSMGALLVYEMSHYLKQQFREPEAVFFSGSLAPNLKEEQNAKHLLPDEQFINVIKELGHSPAELFENPDLLRIFVPILKADYRMLETYIYQQHTTPLASRFNIFRGSKDTSTRVDIEGWAQHTEGESHFYDFQGDHFFLYTNTNEVIKVIEQCLLP
jgi:medium-chain acyl-[acyl-carrier-protein] hydrolase